MSASRLSWRIAFPFAAFMVAGSLALAFWMSWMSVRAEGNRMVLLAQSSAELIQRMRLPPSERMAVDLSEVLHMEVLFQRGDQMVPDDSIKKEIKTMLAIPNLPANGRLLTSVVLKHEIVKRPLMDGWSLVLWRPQLWPWSRALESQTLLALAAFWVAALLLAFAVVRGLVQPLRHLAAKLPDIEKPEPMELPEVSRQDEIGDVARSFMRTRAALQAERAQREQSEKLAVLGRMTAALAHEIQNPVSAIKMHAQLAAMDGHPSAEIMANEAGRIESLVNQWMFLSKPEPPAVSPINVPDLLSRSLAGHRLQLDHAEVFASLKSPQEVMVMGDGKRLQQVFSNLFMNAIQAMPGGGTLTVEVQNTGSRCGITFADTGRGFSGEALERCSEFFYSEKEGGMGIGLSVATEIIKAHGGSLKTENCRESGALVSVMLPCATNP